MFTDDSRNSENITLPKKVRTLPNIVTQKVILSHQTMRFVLKIKALGGIRLLASNPILQSVHTV